MKLITPVPDRFPLLLDLKAQKVGCVLLQAAMGGTSNACHNFNSNAWETDSIEGLKRYVLTRDEYKQVVARFNAAHPDRLMDRPRKPKTKRKGK